MTTTTAQATATAKPRPKKLEGQWKIDGTQPLNRDEEVKQVEPVLEVKQRVIDIYSKQGFDSIPADDLAPRFKWLGMYTQRKQNLGGEHTGKDNSELQDSYFMMRIRFDGGRCTTEQARAVGEISRDWARSTIDLTDRQNIQLHWVKIENVPAIWEKLESVGLSTIDGCGDVPRVILGSPVAGIAADEIIDATPAIETITQDLVTRDEFQNLPRKFKSAISGNARQDVTHEIQDLAFQAVEHPDFGAGFQVYVGGGLSTNPMLAQPLGVFVTLEQVPEVWANVVRIYRDYGYRRLRNRARLKFLVAQWGVEKFRTVLEEYLGYELPDGPAAPANPIDRDHIGLHKQKDGNYYLGVKPTLGHLSGEQLIVVTDLAESYGLTRLRFTPFKELLFLDIPEEKVDALTKDLDQLGLYSTPSEFRRGLLSCTGLEYCKLAHVTTKSRAIELADELEEQFGDLDSPITIALNGCPNACTRTQIADIGLKGQTVTDADGNRVEGFQVHLGGTLGKGANFGRKIRGHKVISSELTDYVTRVVGNYKRDRGKGELFREWLVRADEEDIK
ncbi:nitrite/sulfite reductase [Corynebacterium cystitidis]|uniref:nitrite/sulfite reductase n=1 Tax=Corynebacterium cystitidis TaxID=35757 RepID=UPI00211F2D88|nr:nitrite/sulfite reductase [Corynebacterium cystitidis]